MNVMQDHARVFRQQVCSAIVLYAAVIVGCVAWGVHTMQTLQEQEAQLTAQANAYKKMLAEQSFITIKKEDTHTMQDVKHYLTNLFSIPLPGISFSVLTLDEEGMRVRGRAPSNEAVEQWLEHVRDIFTVNARVVQSTSEKGVVFEVLLHEKS